MTQSFNLIDQPWIPCETLEGGLAELGLRDVLANAHELRGVCGDSPLETASLYRLLLAVLHRVFGPPGTQAWFDLWRRGRWNSDSLNAYWDAWYDRFDLLHPDENRRFYQRKPLTGDAGPIIQMVFSSGDNPALFSHTTNANQPGMTFAQAARAVVTTQVYRPGGFIKGQSGKEKSGYASPAQRGILFLLEGRSLFETTLFNLWTYFDWNFGQVTGLPQTENDAPAWEQEDVFQPSRDLPLGYLDYLSWQSFRIWLEVPETDGRIRNVRLGKGHVKLRDTVHDPFKHYYPSKKEGYRPLDFQEGKALWRDSAAILEQAKARDKQAAKHPYCITWFADLFTEDSDHALDEYTLLSVSALGMKGDQAKIEFYRQERMVVPAVYLRDPHLASTLRTALTKVENAGSALSKALKDFVKQLGDHESKLVEHWGVERQYWGAIEPAFWWLVTDLPARGESALAEWNETLLKTARDAYASAENLAGSDARALKAAAAGRGTLERFLAPLRREIEQWQIAQKLS